MNVCYAIDREGVEEQQTMASDTGRRGSCPSPNFSESGGRMNRLINTSKEAMHLPVAQYM